MGKMVNKDKIIRMAREAGLFEPYAGNPTDLLQRFAALVAKDERESCALICDHEMDNALNLSMKITAGNCADKIRARD